MAARDALLSAVATAILVLTPQQTDAGIPEAEAALNQAIGRVQEIESALVGAKSSREAAYERSEADLKAEHGDLERQLKAVEKDIEFHRTSCEVARGVDRSAAAVRRHNQEVEDFKKKAGDLRAAKQTVAGKMNRGSFASQAELQLARDLSNAKSAVNQTRLQLGIERGQQATPPVIAPTVKQRTGRESNSERSPDTRDDNGAGNSRPTPSDKNAFDPDARVPSTPAKPPVIDPTGVRGLTAFDLAAQGIKLPDVTNVDPIVPAFPQPPSLADQFSNVFTYNPNPKRVIWGLDGSLYDGDGLRLIYTDRAAYERDAKRAENALMAELGPSPEQIEKARDTALNLGKDAAKKIGKDVAKELIKKAFRVSSGGAGLILDGLTPTPIAEEPHIETREEMMTRRAVDQLMKNYKTQSGPEPRPGPVWAAPPADQ